MKRKIGKETSIVVCVGGSGSGKGSGSNSSTHINTHIHNIYIYIYWDILIYVKWFAPVSDVAITSSRHVCVCVWGRCNFFFIFFGNRLKGSGWTSIHIQRVHIQVVNTLGCECCLKKEFAYFPHMANTHIYIHLLKRKGTKINRINSEECVIH